MALTAGSKLGPYEIQSLLGAGGMGEVYRALNTRLDRSALEFGIPQTLISNWTVLGTRLYDISPHGKKILLDRMPQQVSRSVTVLTNFTAGLKK